MARGVWTIRTIVRESGLDPEEALILLWEAGFDRLRDIDDAIPRRQVESVRSALGLASRRELQKIAYWERRLDITRGEIVALLAALGTPVSASARVLPKGALARLRQHAPTASHETDAPPGVAADADASSAVDTEFCWRTIGAERSPEHLSVEEITQIHEMLEVAFSGTADPISPPGVRDSALLESACHRPRTSLGGYAKYKSAEMAASALLHSIVHNHPFYNGNKRTALVALLVSLDRNGLLLTCDHDELFRFVLRVAQHRLIPRDLSNFADREVSEIAQWVHINSRQIARGDRTMPWRELRKILSRHDCTISSPQPGNKVKVHRTVEVKGFLGRRKTLVLTAHAAYRGEGRDVSSDHIQYIRGQLYLDDEHGYDSGYFYGQDRRSPDEFVSEYRNILKKLAKL